MPVADARRYDTLLDVPRVRLSACQTGAPARHELDMDAPLLPLRNTGTDVPRMEMAPHSRPVRRKSAYVYVRQLHIPLLRSQPHRAARGRVCTLRSAATL